LTARHGFEEMTSGTRLSTRTDSKHDSDEQLSEDEDISPFESNLDTDSDNGRDCTHRLQTVE
jgi:hypothetical protein